MEAHMSGLSDDKGEVFYNVYVDDVKAASISDAEYGRIWRQVASDKRVFCSQVLNGLAVIWNMLSHCFFVVPICFFWAVIALATHSPGSISTLLVAFRNATPESIRYSVKVTESVVVVTALASIVLRWAFGHGFGSINRVEEAIKAGVREHCGLSKNGEVTIRCVMRAASSADAGLAEPR
jgi:hypothetical protein